MTGRECTAGLQRFPGRNLTGVILLPRWNSCGSSRRSRHRSRRALSGPLLLSRASCSLPFGQTGGRLSCSCESGLYLQRAAGWAGCSQPNLPAGRVSDALLYLLLLAAQPLIESASRLDETAAVAIAVTYETLEISVEGGKP